MKTSELLIRLPKTETSSLLKLWEWTFPPEVVPICFSLFGDWFMKDGEGKVRMFEITSGDLKTIADSEQEFWALAEVDEFQEKWFLLGLVAALIASGSKLEPGQCYAFRTPPFLGGPMTVSNVVTWDFKLHQQGTRKLLQQLQGLQPGTHIVIKPK